MLTSTRRASILRRVAASGEASVLELAESLNVSASTIRRDLNSLDADGLLRRVRGGGSVEPDREPFQQVATQATSAKERIAERAAALVVDGDVVVLDIGTTAALVARRLAGRRITVITASVAVLDELRDDEGIELILLGGVLRRSYHSLVGSLTEDALSQLRGTICFLGTSGVLADGTVMDSTGAEVPIKRAILTSSARTVLVADDSKFPGTGILSVCPASRIDVVVTSGEHPTLDVFRTAGSTVILA
ncbi:MAG: DeoR/GlpR transcriptional regulator [Burkholderiaceae bacterium]|nr:DeoR/GlpR transcriptional regulator [Microbacteriaceae bacterium]